MAEYLLKSRLPSDFPWVVMSAGLGAFNGAPPSEASVKVMKEYGIDIRKHRSRQVDESLIKNSDLVITMTRSQAEEIKYKYPSAAANVYVLNSFSPVKRTNGEEDIIDPIGLSEDVYRNVRDQIDIALTGLLSFMQAIEKN